jgi:thioester reductase-like protein
MEEILILLTNLASKGIKLSVEGDDLRCYAPKGSLTKEVRDCILRNKPKIIDRLRDYIDFQAVLAPSTARRKAQAIGELDGRAEKRPVPPTESPLDLAAEAVLDPEIQPSAAISSDVHLAASKAVLLTGASGFLGAYLLNGLMAVTEACVYCLVRCRSEEDGGERIKNNLLKYGLWSDGFASRIVPVPGDLALPLLGVGAEKFDTLCNVIDTIYHNGAVVNFIYPYSSLKDSNVRGTEEVIRLASRVRRKPLHFISTIGVFPPTTQRDTKVFESDPPGNWPELIGGYPQSKWVAERLVAIAADRGLPVRIYRPGFVAGDSTTGIWNTDDLVPRMIKGCIQLGSAPDIDAMIEIVPVDYVSKAIVHLSRQRELQSDVFHVVGPRYIPVRELFHIVGSLGYKITMLPYADWRKLLFDDAKTSSKNALFPLLTGFASATPLEMPAFDCRRTLEGLKGTQIVCPEISTSLVATYLTYFRNSGFLDA